ncbi:hypothetical protein ACOMHN_012948 [Nucella lapillus]
MALLRRSLFVCCLVLMRWASLVSGFTTGNETALRTALFNTSQYDVSVRPSDPTIVSLTLVPTSLNSIDIKAQTMSISGWWVLSWTDSRLTWDPNNYDGISETHVFEDDLWTPTIVVYNSVNDLSAIDEDTIPIQILSSGDLEWSPPGILTVSCNTDISHFPFDTQTCGVSVKTFGYTVQHLELEADADEINMNYYSESGEWKLLSTSTHKVNLYNYTQVTFNFKVKRKPEFYGMNLVLPVIMMAVMGLFIYLLPAESGEKMGYSLTVMLTFVVLMTLLADRMPSTADHTSYFEVYVVLVLAMCSLSVVLSIFSLNLYFKDDAVPIPARAQHITSLLMRILCYGKRNQTNITTGNMFVVTASHVDEQHSNPRNNSTSQDRKWSDSSPLKRMEPSGGAAVPAARGEPEVTWKKMSMVMDAFCFRMYIAVFILITVIFLSILASP